MEDIAFSHFQINSLFRHRKTNPTQPNPTTYYRLMKGFLLLYGTGTRSFGGPERCKCFYWRMKFRQLLPMPLALTMPQLFFFFAGILCFHSSSFDYILIAFLVRDLLSTIGYSYLANLLLNQH